MIPIDCVSRFRWTLSCGQRLKTLRGKISRRDFVDRIKFTLGDNPEGVKISVRSLQAFEEGMFESIDYHLSTAICQTLDISIEGLLDICSAKISI